MAQIDFVGLLKRIASHPAFLLVIGFILVVLAIGLPQAALQAIMPLRGRTDGQHLVVNVLVVAATIGAYRLFTRWIERRPSRDLELAGAAREWGFGALLGFGAMTATIGVIWLLGGYRITGSNPPSVLVAVAAMAVISGFTEEILLRGVVFRLLERWLGSFAALALSAALFGALHLGNPNSSRLAAFAIAIEAGILLAAIYMLTRRLWAAIGLHMAWNATQGGLYGVKVSGTDIQGLLTSDAPGSTLISGGAFGAEASLPAMVICTGLGLWILALAWRKGQFVRASWQRFKTGHD